RRSSVPSSAGIPVRWRARRAPDWVRGTARARRSPPLPRGACAPAPDRSPVRRRLCGQTRRRRGRRPEPAAPIHRACSACTSGARASVVSAPQCRARSASRSSPSSVGPPQGPRPRSGVDFSNLLVPPLVIVLGLLARGTTAPRGYGPRPRSGPHFSNLLVPPLVIVLGLLARGTTAPPAFGGRRRGSPRRLGAVGDEVGSAHQDDEGNGGREHAEL